MAPSVMKPTEHFRVQEVADGVFAAIAKAGTGSVANAGFVDMGHSVVVFDSFNTQQAAAELREVIQRIVGKPVSHLLNSHWHGDHIRGNQMFRDVPILATTKTRHIMADRHPTRIAQQKAGMAELAETLHQIRETLKRTEDPAERDSLQEQISFLGYIQASLPGLDLTLPSQTFDTCWTLEGSARTIHCVAMGPAHTQSDAVLHIPDAKVLFAGDVLVVGGHLPIMDGDILAWIDGLRHLQTWDLAHILPGHGPVNGPMALETGVQYLSTLLQLADRLTAEGTAPESLTADDIPLSCRNWPFGEIFLRNMRHLMHR